VRVALTALVILGLVACKLLPPAEVPKEVVEELLDPQTASQIRALQTQGAVQAEANPIAGFAGSQTLHSTPPEEQIAAARSILDSIAKDPTFLSDPAKLKALASPEGFDAEVLVMEWENGKALDPKSKLLQNAQSLLRAGWAIQRVGYDQTRRVLLLYWVRLMRLPRAPGPASGS